LIPDYQIINYNNSKELAKFLSKEGQFLLPMLELIAPYVEESCFCSTTTAGFAIACAAHIFLLGQVGKENWHNHPTRRCYYDSGKSDFLTECHFLMFPLRDYSPIIRRNMRSLPPPS